MKYYIGIDLGTSAVKLMLVDADGQIKRVVSRDYPVSYPHVNWSEQDPKDWWNAISDALFELLSGYDGQAVAGIGIAGQMHGLVVLDKNDRVIRPAILWNDGRADKETDYLNFTLGKEKLFEYTGNIAFAGFTAPKLMWMRKNEPESFAKISKIMLPKDYINYILTGVHCTDLSDASGFLMLDVKNKRWSAEMLDICGVNEEQMPRLYESFDVVGKIKGELAKKFGISKDAIVVAGAGDNAAAALGTGTVGEGRCNISVGTSGTIFVPCKSFFGDYRQAIHSFCHADGGYHLMGVVMSAAYCNKWLCNDILTTSDYDAEERSVKDRALGKNDVFFLPYIMGERSPINDTDATGTFVGLRGSSSRADVYQAVLEGVAFAFRDNLEIIRNFGIDIKSSCICGGGTRSKLWCKIIANVLNLELHLPLTEQGPGYGSAILAMVGAGESESVVELAEKLFKVNEVIRPDPELVSLYNERYERYRKIYPALKKLYKDIK
ncbi:MAG: xylulokinase [Ruminococcaceae bacterium]|nr:xylulokinase [Oscillospiraceae bacterium]